MACRTSNMSLTPVIKTVDFAKERDESIDSLIRQLENPRQNHKRVFQTLPKHLRRRAMSYDVRKVPKAMRPSVEAQVNGAADAKARNKPKGRDPRKFRDHGWRLAEHRNGESRWLETHIWHAKRFHMSNLWGWKIPMSPTMKQTRNLVRMTKENCTMRDVSFTAVISVKGARNEINEFLRKMIRSDARIEQNNNVLFQEEFFSPNMCPKSPIGPADLFWVDNNHLWIICHPLLKGDLAEIFKSNEGFDVELIDGELNIFEIFGPNATNAIRKVLIPNNENLKEIRDIITALPDPSAVPPGFSIAYVAFDPRTIDESESPEGNLVNSFDPNINNYKNICKSRLFSDRAFNFKSDEDFNAERSKLLFPKSEGPTGAIPIILMQKFSQNGFGSCWLIISPFGCGNVIFRKLVHRGVRVFGLDCSNLINLEANKFSFPYDRPETLEGFKKFTNEILDLIQENEKRPPGKRKALDFFQFPDSFYVSTFTNPDSFVRVCILMAKRGTPSRFSTIYIPEPEDYSLVGQATEIKGSRKSAGIVMNGNSSLLAGEGRGLGLVLSQVIFIILPQNEESINFNYSRRPKQSRLVLIREQGSQFLHPAWISIHPSNYYP